MPQMTPDDVLTRAAALAGSTDFGSESYREGLARTLDALDAMPLTEAARADAIAQLVREMATRAGVEAWHRAHPGAADGPIEGPVLVCGMPRTGTTATVGMLALDPRFRFLRNWEGRQPLPPPVAGEEDRDPRVVAARAAAASYARPELHIHDPDGPGEDIVYLAGLNGRGYHGALPMPRDYRLWWATEDFTSTYAYYRRVLTMLQAERPPSLWLMKAPPHLFHLDAFARVFPETRYVWTHRDPVKVIPSTASLQHRMQSERALPGSLDPAASGRDLLELWRIGVERGLAARAAIGEERFVDVRNEEVVRDPVATFARVHAHLGHAMDEAMRARVEDYAARNRPGARGEHRYAAEDFGLTDAGIRDAFAGYRRRFGL